MPEKQISTIENIGYGTHGSIPVTYIRVRDEEGNTQQINFASYSLAYDELIAMESASVLSLIAGIKMETIEAKGEVVDTENLEAEMTKYHETLLELVEEHKLNPFVNFLKFTNELVKSFPELIPVLERMEGIIQAGMESLKEADND